MGIERRDDELWFVSEDEDGPDESREDRVPAKFEVCRTCHGKGSHSLAIDGHGITEEERERDWDDESWGAYLAGAYDRPCETCRGLRVTLEIDWGHPNLTRGNDLTDFGQRIEDWSNAEAEYEAERDAERRMGS